MYQYDIYGLGIHTEIKLYNLEERAVPCDVRVHYGMVPKDIVASAGKGLISGLTPSRAWFRNERGYYVITGGNDIMVHPIGDVEESEFASFILGWCIAFLFQLRGFSAIHSSAIEMGEQAVLISGASGAGKSTTALSLIHSGYRYLADDIAMVNPKADMMIQPAFPQQKVCRNVAEQMQPDQLVYINEKKDKFACYNTEDFCDEPRKLTTMFILRRHDGDGIRVEEMRGIAKLNAVFQSLFLLDPYLEMGFPIEEQSRCLDIAGKITIYKIFRPQDKDTVEEVRDTIIKLMEG